MAHATCPQCDEPGYVINQPVERYGLSAVADSVDFELCYGAFGVVIH